MARINLKIADVDTSDGYDAGGNHYIVQVSPNKVYLIYIDKQFDILLAKSTNNGLTWDEPQKVISNANTIGQLSYWYDGWSDINSSNLIHIAWSDTLVNYYYANYNTTTDTVSSTTTIVDLPYITAQSAFLGLSLTRAKGGNLGLFYNVYVSSTGSYFSGFYKSSNTGSTWSSATTPDNFGVGANGILLPEFSSDDSQDMMMISQVETKTVLYKRFYDNSANTWATSSFGTSSFGYSYGFPFVSAFPDKINSQSVVVAWNQSGYPISTTGAKLQCFTITSASITEKTLIATSSTSTVNAVTACGISYNTLDNNWYAYYGGKPSGGETRSNCNIYYRQSSDQGTTWSSELPLTKDIPSIFNTQSFGLSELIVPPIVTTYNMVAFLANASDGGTAASTDPLYINTFFPTAGGSIVIS